MAVSNLRLFSTESAYCNQLPQLPYCACHGPSHSLARHRIIHGHSLISRCPRSNAKTHAPERSGGAQTAACRHFTPGKAPKQCLSKYCQQTPIHEINRYKSNQVLGSGTASATL